MLDIVPVSRPSQIPGKSHSLLTTNTALRTTFEGFSPGWANGPEGLHTMRIIIPYHAYEGLHTMCHKLTNFTAVEEEETTNTLNKTWSRASNSQNLNWWHDTEKIAELVGLARKIAIQRVAELLIFNIGAKVQEIKAEVGD